VVQTYVSHNASQQLHKEDFWESDISEALRSKRERLWWLRWVRIVIQRARLIPYEFWQLIHYTVIILDTV
jgi:hypothetical protein